MNLSPDDILTRRLLLILLTGLLATAASASVKEALLSDGFSLLDGLLLLLFFPLFAWISFGFVTAAIGFVLLISRAHPGITPAPRTPHRRAREPPCWCRCIMRMSRRCSTGSPAWRR
ncbi:hypothetical protein P0F65_15360 [Sphingomonas sp. I4]